MHRKYFERFQYFLKSRFLFICLPEFVCYQNTNLHEYLIKYSSTHSAGSIVSRQCDVQRKLHVILTGELAVNFTTTLFATHKILLGFISHPSELIFLRIILQPG